MTLLDNLATNQRGWATQLVADGDSVPTSLVGVRAGAVFLSIVITNSRLLEGDFDEAAQAAVAMIKSRGADDIIVSGDTELTYLTGGARRALIIAACSGSGRAMAVSTITKTALPGRGVVTLPSGGILDLIKNHRYDARVSWKSENIKFDNRILDLEERFGVPPS